MSRTFEFDVAISYAGEDRYYADQLARALTQRGVKVYYDQYDDAWGKNLYTHLSSVYQKKARYCIILISENYVGKLWTSQELRAAQARAFNESEEYILPLRLDDSEIEGILPTVAYRSWPPEDAETISDAVLMKLKRKSDTTFPGGLMKESVQAPPSISSFQHRLEIIYGKANKQLSVEYIFGYLSRTIGYLCKKVANNRVDEEDFIRPLSWLFAFSSKVGIEVEDAFLRRYPEHCPHCLQRICLCFKTGKNPPEYIPGYKVKEELDFKHRALLNTKHSIGFDFACKTISSIYPNNDVIMHHAGPWYHFSKLQEEVAEVHEALSIFRKEPHRLSVVSEEVADVFSWVVGLWKIKFLKKSLDQELINYFVEGCPVCHQSICSCKPYSGRPDTLLDPKLLSEINTHLKELMDLLPAHRNELEELIRSLDVSESSQSEPVSRLSIAQAAMKLKRIKRAGFGNESEDREAAALLALVLSLIERTYK